MVVPHFRRHTYCLKGDIINHVARKMLHLVPIQAQEKKRKRDSIDSYHITIVTLDEMIYLEHHGIDIQDALNLLKDNNVQLTVHNLGLAKVGKEHDEGWYVVIHCEWADLLRQELGLHEKDFHITLGFSNSDSHGGNPGNLMRSIISFPSEQEYCLIARDICKDEFICKSSNFASRELNVLLTVIETLTQKTEFDMDNIKTLKCIAKWCMRRTQTYLIANMLESIGQYLLTYGILFGLKIILFRCKSMRIESRVLIQELLDNHKLPVILHPTAFIDSKAEPSKLHAINLQCGDLGNNTAISMKHTAGGTSKEVELGIYTLPRNFSWVDLTSNSTQGKVYKELLAGSAYPTKETQIIALYGVGIRMIITLHENPIPEELIQIAKRYGIASHYFHVYDRTPPSLEQLETICNLIQQNVNNEMGTLVHCQGGVGRTNTAIIAYLMKAHDISPSSAIESVRCQRKMILSQSQETSLKTIWFYTKLNKSLSDVVENNKQTDVQQTTPLEFLNHDRFCKMDKYRIYYQSVFRTLAKRLKLPPIILLCGTVASGKSTFSSALVNAFPDSFCRVNKDEMRGKGECDNVLFDAMRKYNIVTRGTVEGHTGIVLLDNCNLTAQVRQTWIDSVHRVRIWCVYFTTDVTLCKHRVQHRVGHPTIPSGERGIGIIDDMVKILEPPQLTEGFEKIITLNSESDVQQLFEQWVVPFEPPEPLLTQTEIDQKTWERIETECSNKPVEEAPLLKFPRTPHIVNLGAATRDDKVLGLEELKNMVDRKIELVVEEKMDGANMGISIDPITNIIMVQNRSHFISAKYHPQFQPLDHWLQKNSADLYNILEPGRHILYGEWLYATHSVYYNKLPNFFIAYDLFDRKDNIFYSRKRLMRILQNTSICVAPLVFQGIVQSTDQLLGMVDGPSEFINVEDVSKGKREGVVVRLCEKGRLLSRAKLVRNDFIAGNERWNKTHKLATNRLDHLFVEI